MNNLITDERTVAEILNDALEANPQIKQISVAEAAGLPKPNVIYMFKTGKTTVPLDKAGKVAEAVLLDPREFWFKCLKEYMPGAFSEFERYCKQPALNSNEVKFIKAARSRGIDLMKLLDDYVANNADTE